MNNSKTMDDARSCAFVTPLQWVAPASQRVRHLAPGHRSGFLRTSWIWHAMHPHRSILVAPVLESYGWDVGPRAGTLHRSTGSLQIMLVSRQNAERVDDVAARGHSRLERVAPLAPADLHRVDCSSAKDTIEQVLKLPLERRQIPFLVSKAALKRCSIWGEMSGSKGDKALAEYKKALDIIRSGKRQAVAAAAPSSSKKKSKASGSSPEGSPSAPYDWATVLTNLNAKVFPSTPVLLASEEDSSMAIQSLQGGVSTTPSRGEDGRCSFYKSRDGCSGLSVARGKNASLAKDKEIKALRLKVRNQEEPGELAAAENVSLRSQLKNREVELNDLKDAAETFVAEKAMAVNGAKYKVVKTTEAELLGLPPPSFEYEPQVPSGEEVKKAPEPDADDPPAE
ncbi:hypothetical protein F2Q69_00013517 [Brassica cretica]|uniref:Uncharacterized protein n=1 Tax=Brassica cretica TaxID=69181 RepID=A0A8S9R0X0_BRACR|nr:hypothetical protein F2Q69_00013517 [Brassica cretica]